MFELLALGFEKAAIAAATAPDLDCDKTGRVSAGVPLLVLLLRAAKTVLFAQTPLIDRGRGVDLTVLSGVGTEGLVNIAMRAAIRSFTVIDGVSSILLLFAAASRDDLPVLVGVYGTSGARNVAGEIGTEGTRVMPL